MGSILRSFSLPDKGLKYCPLTSSCRDMYDMGMNTTEAPESGFIGAYKTEFEAHEAAKRWRGWEPTKTVEIVMSGDGQRYIVKFAN